VLSGQEAKVARQCHDVKWGAQETWITNSSSIPSFCVQWHHLVGTVSHYPVPAGWAFFSIVTCRMVRVTKWQVLVRMIGFISPLVTHSLLITFLTQAIQRCCWFTHIPVHRCSHTLGFSVSTSHLIATDLSTETSTQITTNITHKIFKPHFKSSQADLLYSSLRQLTTSHGYLLVTLLHKANCLLSVLLLPNWYCINLHNSRSILVLVLSTAEPSWALHQLTTALNRYSLYRRRTDNTEIKSRES
jgi:hypothetical protein